MKNEVDFLMEWAVWAHLDSRLDLETVLLIGHLLIENVMDVILERSNEKGYGDFSFHRKVFILENIKVSNEEKKTEIIKFLKNINKLRNKLAHEFQFEIKNGELEDWALTVLANFNGVKFSKYTFRTKIVHAFSTLSINALEIFDS